MVCDFKALKLAVADFLDAFDHALAVNSDDPEVARLREGRSGGRLVIFEGEDPTTEVMARRIFEHVAGLASQGGSFADAEGNTYRLRDGLTVERVRVTETSSSWAEFGIG
jgi:6-pyruvoyltetrahydropterin/6-carboxytetrahydropterin synthase